MDPDTSPPPARTASRVLSVLAVMSASAAAGVLLFPDPLADVFFAAWVLVAVGLSAVGAFGAWTDRTPLVWVTALSLAGLSVVGMWSIGPFVALSAVFLLGAALHSRLAGPRTAVREATVADPPTVSESVGRMLAGAATVVVGGGLLYVGAVRRELFGACASETLACVIETTHWGAVGIAALGAIAVGIGGWLFWTQVSLARTLWSARAG